MVAAATAVAGEAVLADILIDMRPTAVVAAVVASLNLQPTR